MLIDYPKDYELSYLLGKEQEEDLTDHFNEELRENVPPTISAKDFVNAAKLVQSKMVILGKHMLRNLESERKEVVIVYLE